MTHKIDQQLAEIEAILSRADNGLSRGEIKKKLYFPIENKTLQRRLSVLVADGRVRKEGDKRTAHYFSIGTNTFEAIGVQEPKGTYKSSYKDTLKQVFSKKSLELVRFLETPVYFRPKVSYKRDFLDGYVPNETVYVPIKVRNELKKAGERLDTAFAAGTYARQILNRLLIELSYNSSRLEGNTYSRLDTQRLIEQNISARGKVHEETVMIMNHKEAISFLIENAEDIDVNTFTIYGLHYLLSQDLLANPEAYGQIRQVEVMVGKSTYRPMSNPHQIKEILELLLLKARKISDPFEQSFFLLLHLSYLQAFEDVNKRTARLACNIPFIKMNLCPLSFTDLPKEDYLSALLMFYETNDIRPMLDVFRWAYLKSCAQYDGVRDSVGPVDAFRIRYRQQRKEVLGQIIRRGLHAADIEKHTASYCAEYQIEDAERFVAMTMADLKVLHVGAIIDLGITEKQFHAWKLAETQSPGLSTGT